MIVPICIDLIHFNKKAHLYMYLKYADVCRHYKFPLIVDEFYSNWEPENNNEIVAQQGIAQRWLYEYMDKQERKCLDQYIIPSAILDELIDKKNSKLDVSLALQLEDYPPLIKLLEKYINDITKKYNEKIDAFLILEKVPQSVNTIAQKYNIPVLGIGKGPLRCYGYRDTAYINWGDVYGTDECEERYNKFVEEWDNQFELFDNKELLAIFLCKDLLPYLKLYDMSPINEMLVAGTYTIMPTLFSKTSYSDIEVLREVQELYPNRYSFRPNPADPYESYYHLPQRLIDKESPNILSILKSYRVASMGSNMLFDTILWGRNAYTRGNLFPFSFMCEHDYAVRFPDKVPLEFLNFFCFSYLAPFEYMCDYEYLKWRLTKPSEKEIFMRNIAVYLNELGITKDIIKMPRGARLRAILRCREVDPDISISNDRNVLPTQALFSELIDHMGASHISLNARVQGNIISSTFAISRKYTNKDLIFKPINKQNIKIKIHSCIIDGKVSKFRPIGGGIRENGIDNFTNIVPEYVLNGDFSRCTEMKINWSIIEDPTQSIHSRVNTIKSEELMDKETHQKLEMLDNILNSKSWKLLEPLRKIRYKQLKIGSRKK